MKKCGQCRKLKPLNEFKTSKRTEDGFQWCCKPCAAHRNNMQKLRNRGIITTTPREQRGAKHQRKADPQPGGKVCCCGCYRKLDEHFHTEWRPTKEVNGKLVKEGWCWHSECWRRELRERAGMFEDPGTIGRIDFQSFLVDVPRPVRNPGHGRPGKSFWTG